MIRKFLILTVVFAALTAAVSQFIVSAEKPNFSADFSNNINAMQDATSGTYALDKAHSSIGFRVKHMGLVEVPGYFRDFTGTVNFDAASITNSSVTFTAKATSVDTGVAPRDNHLRTKDFFEVETYPELSFKSTKIEKNGTNYTVYGDFTMHGVTKQISFPFQIAGFLKDAKGGVKMGATAETTINRRDYGINYGNNLPNGSPMLSDDIKVVLQLEANLQQPGAAKTE